MISNFTMRDNSSEFAKYLPGKWIEPLTIIARIKGYDSIDDYILRLIKGRLQMFVDTGDTIEYEEFQVYMHNTMIGKDVKNPWTPDSQEVKDTEEKAGEQETI